MFQGSFFSKDFSDRQCNERQDSLRPSAFCSPSAHGTRSAVPAINAMPTSMPTRSRVAKLVRNLRLSSRVQTV
ncbi:hypothetical protein MTO96_009207 [Rhipicephalus appendiculatus]